MPVRLGHNISLSFKSPTIVAIDRYREAFIENVFKRIESLKRSVIDIKIYDTANSRLFVCPRNPGKDSVLHAKNGETCGSTFGVTKFAAHDCPPNFGKHQRAVREDMHTR